MQPNRRQMLSAGLGAFSVLGPARLGRGPQDPPPGGASDYDLDPELAYLNHASIGTMPRLVRTAYGEHTRVCETNPWLHIWGDAWEQAVERAHAAAADYLGCRPGEVAIVRNTTEGFSLLAQGLPLGEGDEVLFSSLNHVGASASWTFQAERRGYTVRQLQLPESESASLDSERLISLHLDAISESTRVLVLPHVDNVFGLRHPIAAIAKGARERGVRWIAVDAAQSVGMFPFAVSDLGADFVATSAHKWLQAPKGTGLFYASPSATAELDPMVVTWGQRSWHDTARSFSDYGTRDLAKVLALGDALAYQAEVRDRVAHHRSLREHAQERAQAHPALTFRSPATWEAGSALVAIGAPAGQAPRLASELFGKHGIVLRGFGGTERNTLRLSPNLANDRAQLDRCFDALEGLLS